MHFLARFIKIFVGSLLFASIGVIVFYFTVMYGKNIRSGLSRSEYLQTVYVVLGSLVGFLLVLSVLLALIGMKATTSLPVQDRARFVEKFRSAMSGLRYRPLSEDEHFLIFKPPVIGGLLAENISLELKNDLAVITAPKGLIGKLRAKL